MIPWKFVSYFSEFYFIFYAFLKFIRIFENIKENENRKPAHSSGPVPDHDFGLMAQPNRGSGPCVGTVARPARLASSLPDEEVFTSSIGALRGGGRARWGDEILTATAGRWRGGGQLQRRCSSDGELLRWWRRGAPGSKPGGEVWSKREGRRRCDSGDGGPITWNGGEVEGMEVRRGARCC
jgi:hypothetical protein